MPDSIEQIRDDIIETRGQDRSNEARLEADIKLLQADIKLLQAVVQSYQSVFADAAGELPIPIPAAGTTEAKLLAANIVMRRQRDRFKNDRCLLLDILVFEGADSWWALIPGLLSLSEMAWHECATKAEAQRMVFEAAGIDTGGAYDA